MKNPMDLSGKVALVTGAGSGFGAGIAKLFVELGARVVGADINEKAAKDQAAQSDPSGKLMTARKTDVSDAGDMASCFEYVLSTFGKLDIVINNAGFTHANRPMLEIDEETFDKVMAVNVKSIYLSAVNAVPIMREGGGGSIVNIASTAGVRPRPGLTWYNGTKGAAIILTKSMAAEVATDNIRVNAINPVMGETGMLDKLLPPGDPEEARAKVIAGIPLGRFSKPLDIANAAAFLASDSASMITGATLEVDGGRCI